MVEDAVSRKSGSKAVVWNALGVLFRQALLIVSTVVLARVLGPSGYGVVALVLVYTSITTLLLDQGLSTWLVRAKDVTRENVASAQTINIVLSMMMGGITVASAHSLAGVFHSPNLGDMLVVLGIALPLKGLGVVPRVLLARALNFRLQALADVIASIFGLCAVVCVLAFDASPWAFVAQVIVSDLILSAILTYLAKPPLPNSGLNGAKQMVQFGGRVLASNGLAYIVQNTDNLLIARYIGDASLALYSVAYRFVTLPVQLVGQIISRVLYAVVAQKVNDNQTYLPAIRTTVRCLSVLVLPGMALICVHSTTIVEGVLGNEWKDSALPLSILAVAGARQAITTINSPVMMALDRVKELLRFSLLAAAVQVSAIVIGLQWGIVGVAAAFTVAGFLLTPIISLIQHRYARYGIGMQCADIWPALHGTIWIAATAIIGNIVTDAATSIHVRPGPADVP
jgi:PST family polysaccharide transporter